MQHLISAWVYPGPTAVLTMENIEDPKPSPPDDPLIEEYEEEEEESINVAAEDDPMISVDDKMGEIERVAVGSVNREHQPPPPVILEPARPPPVVLKAKTKVVAKPKPKPDPKPLSKPDVRDQPERATPTTNTLTVAPKARPSQSAPSSGSKRPESSLPSSSDWASHTPESTKLREPQSEVTRIDLTDQTSGASGDLWGAYTGNLNDVRDRPIGADPQMLKGSGREAWGRRHQQTNQTWRPRVRDEARDESRNEEAVIPPWRANQQRHAQRVARPRVRWELTGIYGNREHQWEELWRLHPWVESEDDLWYETSSGEWFVREYF